MIRAHKSLTVAFLGKARSRLGSGVPNYRLGVGYFGWIQAGAVCFAPTLADRTLPAVTRDFAPGAFFRVAPQGQPPIRHCGPESAFRGSRFNVGTLLATC
jgi:hypothetical protein